jgi:Polyketide cyclase / dehydrase and lipid transport
MKIEATTSIKAPAQAIFALYADVPAWPVWDLDVKSASIEGAFVSGARGVIVPKGGPKSNLLFTDVVTNKSFTAQCKLPLCVMRFEHELESAGSGKSAETRVTHRVVFEGLLAPVFGRLIGSGMRKTLPNVMASLKAVAEKSVPA